MLPYCVQRCCQFDQKFGSSSMYKKHPAPRYMFIFDWDLSYSALARLDNRLMLLSLHKSFVILFNCVLKGIKNSCLNNSCIPLTVGFRETIEYYYKTKVKSIYTTVVEALSQNANRRFIAVEMEYFHMWWLEATAEQQSAVYQVQHSY